MANTPMIEREALLFESGDYPDKGVNITDADLDAVITNTQDVPVKIEHMDTPLDGAMGTVTKLWRKGKELWGKIAFPEPMWDMVTAAKAFRLSVGIAGIGDSPHLQEVSLVRTPRVASARVFRFSGGLGFNGFVVPMGLGPLSTSDVMSRLYELLNPDPYNAYVWVEDLYEDFVVISDGTRAYKRALDVSDGGVIDLGDPVEVRRDWIPITAETEPASAFRSDDNNTERKPNTMADENTITMTAEQLDEKLSEAVSKGRAEAAKEAETQISAFKAELEARHDARSFALQLAADGKVSQDSVPHVETICMAGQESRDALSAILDGIPAATTTKPETDDVSSRLFSALGVTAEQVEKHKKGVRN